MPMRPASPGGTDLSRHWSPERRLQIRLFNVLHRWSTALADRRFFWINLAAGVRNYIALLEALGECWKEEYLPEDRLRLLLQSLLESFIRGERSRGYLWLLEEDERRSALEDLPNEAKELAAALVYGVFRDEGTPHPFIFEWQVFLAPALDLDILHSGDISKQVVEGIFGIEHSPTEIQ